MTDSEQDALPHDPPSRRERYARLAALIESWLADESGYDEAVWPRLVARIKESNQTMMTDTEREAVRRFRAEVNDSVRLLRRRQCQILVDGDLDALTKAIDTLQLALWKFDTSGVVIGPPVQESTPESS